MTVYSYGHLTWPDEKDPRFADETEVIQAAEKASNEVDGPVIGIWNDETGELLYIVYQGWLYRPT